MLGVVSSGLSWSVSCTMALTQWFRQSQHTLPHLVKPQSYFRSEFNAGFRGLFTASDLWSASRINPLASTFLFYLLLLGSILRKHGHSYSTVKLMIAKCIYLFEV